MRPTLKGCALVSAWLTTMVFALPATAEVYRCESGGAIVYSDKPCASGVQKEVAVPAPPSSAERAAAEKRQRADEAKALAMQKQREHDEHADASARRKSDAERLRQQRNCKRLAARIRRERDELAAGTVRRPDTKRTRLHHAEEDYAADCGRLEALK